MDLELTTRQLGDAAVVSVGGEIDNYSAPQLRTALTAAVDSGAARVVVDLTDTSFLDSSALGALVGASKHAQGASSALAVVCPKPHLRRLFEISRLDEVLALSDSVDAALAAA